MDEIESYELCRQKLLEYDPKIIEKENKVLKIDAQLQLQKIKK